MSKNTAETAKARVQTSARPCATVGAPPRRRRANLRVAPHLVLPEVCFSQRVAGPETAVRRRAAPCSAIPRAPEQVWSASHPLRQPCRESNPAQRGAPPRRRRALHRVFLREGLSCGHFPHRVACIEFAARRREAPREVCSSAIRCRGPRKTELPKLHSARPCATGRPPTPAKALRRVVLREGQSRGPFSQRVAGPELATLRRATPHGVCSSAIRCR